MKCIKCGGYVYNSDKFCRICGATIKNDNCQYGDNIKNSKFDSSSCHEKQYNYSYEYSNIKQTNDKNTHADQYDYSNKLSIDYSKYNYINTVTDSGDDKYVKAYIGKNYEIIKKSKFSILTFFLGPWYLLYKKLWSPAIALIIINIAAQVLLPESISNLISWIANGIAATNFQKLYLKQAEIKVESIKQQNLDKTTNELLEICAKKGKPIVNLKALLIIAIIIVIILPITSMFLFLGEELNIDNPTPTTTSTINYTKPEDLILLESGPDYSAFKYYTNSTTCNITINRYDLGTIYETAEEYLETYEIEKKYNEEITGVFPIDINNQTWSYASLISSTREETHYAYRANNEIYVIKTYNPKNSIADNISCRKKYNEFIDTITIETN